MKLGREALEAIVGKTISKCEYFPHQEKPDNRTEFIYVGFSDGTGIMIHPSSNAESLLRVADRIHTELIVELRISD